MNDVTTAYIGGHTEWNVTAQEMTRYYLAGGQRVAFRVIKSGQTDKVYYLLADHLGSTHVVMEVGGIVETKTYTAWGKDRTGGITKTDRQYTGQINESELGLYFYNARYYDADLGRFTSADTIIPQLGNPQDWDRYSYTRNNPINYIDPSGHRACFSSQECEAEGITPNGKTTKKFLMNLMSETYGWIFDGVFNYNEITEIYQASQDIQRYIDGITNGGGLKWMKKYMNGVAFTHGGLFGSSFVTGNIMHLIDGWESYKTYAAPHITHELTHVWDNHSATEFGFTHEALWYGGGNADLLIILLGGIPLGLRWANGSGDFLGLGGVPKEYRWLKGYYGNNSTADYMADSFEYMVYPFLGDLPKDKNGWGPGEILKILIVAESSLLP